MFIPYQTYQNVAPQRSGYHFTYQFESRRQHLLYRLSSSIYVERGRTNLYQGSSSATPCRG